MTRTTQRHAVAMASSSELSEVVEYQPTRPRDRKVRIYCPPDGDGFAVAVKDGQSIPPAIVEEFGPWKQRDCFAGWTVYYTVPAAHPLAAGDSTP